jgi:hypothetical protein
MQRKILTPQRVVERVRRGGTRKSLIGYLDLLKKSLKIEEGKGDSYEYWGELIYRNTDRFEPGTLEAFIRLPGNPAIRIPSREKSKKNPPSVENSCEKHRSDREKHEFSFAPGSQWE